MSEADNFFVKYRAKVTGPHAREEIVAMVKKGTLSPIHRVSVDQADWRPLHELEGWQHLWSGTGNVAEPPPLPGRAQQGPSHDDRDEPLDVELLD